MISNWKCTPANYCFIGTFLALASLNASAQEFPLFTQVYEGLPSFSQEIGQKEEMEVKIMCVGKSRGKTYPCTLQSEILGIEKMGDQEKFRIENMIDNLPDLSGCTYPPSTPEFDNEELFINGGHIGTPTTNYTLGTSTYKRDNNPDGTGRYFVEGETRTDGFATKLTYETTARSGIYAVRTILDAPDTTGRPFVFRFRDGSARRIDEDRHIIAIKGLTRLPGCPDGRPIDGANYILIRGDVEDFPEAHWGRRATVRLATVLANSIKRDYGQTMAYNDLSLPLGGDHTEHDTHITGRDIDINANFMNYNCNSFSPPQQEAIDYYIHATFARIFGVSRIRSGTLLVPNLDCYDQPNNPNSFASMHIDVSTGR